MTARHRLTDETSDADRPDHDRQRIARDPRRRTPRRLLEGLAADRHPRRHGRGFAPGDTGTTLIAGHIDNIDQGNGAFHDLYLVQPGESIYTSDNEGHTVRWRTVSMQVVEKAALPHSVFIGVTGPRRLVLVTCGGPRIRYPSGNSYRDNVIVTAIPG
jgi:hypothetical protein